MSGAKQEESQDSFEARVVRSSGEIIDTMWSVHWSMREKSLFCVVHDETERKQAERMEQDVVAMVTHDLTHGVDPTKISEQSDEGNESDQSDGTDATDRNGKEVKNAKPETHPSEVS